MKSVSKIISAAAVFCVLTANALAEDQGGYLFAHMPPFDYGKITYSVSSDGLNWYQLNGAKPVIPDYTGHPDLCQAPDGTWHMMGIVFQTEGKLAYMVHWYSKDLVAWEKEPVSGSVTDVAPFGMKNDKYIGAPKLAYDEEGRQFVITWHAYDAKETKTIPLWQSMRTYYVLTKDFRSFTPPERLLHFTGSDENLATIDVILRKINGEYWAILKDERWPETASTGKSIRMAKSKGGILGPYENPGPSVTLSWHEAPCLVTMPDGTLRIYVEDYQNKSRTDNYKMFEAPKPEGPWKQHVFVSPNARHGCIVPIDAPTMKKIISAFGSAEEKK